MAGGMKSVNKVVVDGVTRLDLTKDSVTPQTLLAGATAHNAAGEQIEGTYLGSDPSLGITGATVGQIAKIAAVDTDGKPTAWEPVDIAGGETWEKITDVAFTADTPIYKVANFGVYRKVKVLMSRAAYVSGLNKNVWFRIRRFENLSLGSEVAAVFLNPQYGYKTWEVNAEVDAFVYMSRQMTNNPVTPSAIEKTIAILPPVEPRSLEFSIEFVDTSVIQDGDTVAIYGVKR